MIGVIILWAIGEWKQNVKPALVVQVIYFVQLSLILKAISPVYLMWVEYEKNRQALEDTWWKLLPKFSNKYRYLQTLEIKGYLNFLTLYLWLFMVLSNTLESYFNIKISKPKALFVYGFELFCSKKIV